MLYPAMLLGLLGLAAPIVIHLIQRQRLKPTPLATTHFLDPQDVANAFAPTPRDLIQLLLRCLLLALVVLLMARLTMPGSETGPRTLAVVVDTSMSMTQKSGEVRSRWDDAREGLEGLIDSMRDGDKVSLIAVSDRVTLKTPFLEDPEALREAAESLRPGGGGGLAVVPAIREAVGELRSQRAVNAAVVVFSDHQASNYEPYVPSRDREEQAGDALASGLYRSLEGSAVRVLLVDDGDPAGVNLSLLDAEFTPDRVYVGASSRATATVKNHTEEEQTASITVSENDTVGQERSIPLMPGEEAKVDLVQRFESPVDTPATVSLEEDALPGDNVIVKPMRMRSRKQVLVVSASESGEAEDAGLELGTRGVDLLTYAINPGEALGSGSGTYVNARQVSPGMLPRVSLPLYSVIVLYGVSDLPEQSEADVMKFVENGGGLLIVPGPDVPPARFNQGLAEVLNGVMLGAVRNPDGVAGVSQAEGEVTDPMLLPMLRGGWGNLQEVYFQRYYPFESTGTARVALRTDTGDPLVLVQSRGRGEVAVLGFNLNLEATSLPRTMVFVPMVQRLVTVLSGEDEVVPVDALRVGEVLRVDVSEFRGQQGPVIAKGPGDVEVEFPLTGAESSQIRVQGLQATGAYQLSHPSKPTGRQRWIAVNPVVGESDLTEVSGATLADFYPSDQARRLDRGELEGAFANRHELIGWMLVLVFLLFAAEALHGAWQSRKREEA